jgi:ADP-ribosylation factor-binding protein GGA
MPGPALISTTTEHSTARGPLPTFSPTPQQSAAIKPDYSAFSAFGSPSHPVSQSTTPQPSLFQQQQQAALANKPQPPPPASDPFAALASPVRDSTPQQPTPSMFEFASLQPPKATPAPLPAADDDEWAFSSALPEGLPSSNIIAVSRTSLNIDMTAYRESQTPTIINLSMVFSNQSDQPISELMFMAAVTKVGYPPRHPIYLVVLTSSRAIL